MIKHTPGPWTWVERFRGLYGAGPNNVVLDYAPYNGLWLDGPSMEANARLIAAAPDLLEALQAILGHEAHLLNPYRVESARAAIDKATGEQA